jgi:N-acetylmuramoyl-L-alanine amidase
MHTMGGFLAGTDSWFNNPAAQVSTHYGIGLKGDVHQYVGLDDTAWGNGVLEAGNRWPYPGNPNGLSISIETEDRGIPQNTPVSPEMLASASALIALIKQQKPSIELLTSHHIISPRSRVNCAGKRWTDRYLGELAQQHGLRLLI